MSRPRIAVLATLDTKLEETRFVADRIRDHGGQPIVINLGTADVDDALVDIRQSEVRSAGGTVSSATDKVALMQSAAAGAATILRDGIHGGAFDAAIAIGGGQGSWMSSAALRDLPVGFPRLLVSTAGRDVGQYARFSDLTSVFSITDVAGLNPILKRVLTTASAGIVGMSKSTTWREPLPSGLSAITVYGITTPGAHVVMGDLAERGIETVAFHANGVGGPTMEGQIAAGTFEAVLDWSITEVADDVVGGVCAAGPERLTSAPRRGLPQVIVPGGIDVVNFGAPETLPAHLWGRRVHAHTPEATLLRTDAAENAEIARLVAARLVSSTAPIHVIVPMGGFSMLSTHDGPLADTRADEAFFDTMRAELASSETVTVTSHPGAINAPEFAHFVAEDFASLVRTHSHPFADATPASASPNH
ncbi:MAG: Tm-1-like ATP-binding domain-containing protein [Actinobacteria bacterium]|nr:Tm-1-like ATP-binding domain-containing protein [Actinomycetota bacterium]